MALIRQSMRMSGTWQSLVTRLLCIGILLIMWPYLAHAQATSAGDGSVYTAKAVVMRIDGDATTSDPGSYPQYRAQTVEAKFLAGIERGKTVRFEIDYQAGDGMAVRRGDTIYVSHYKVDTDSPLLTLYSYQKVDNDRLPVVITFLLLFFGCVVCIGGKQGVRGVISLAGGISLIVFVFLPGVLHGFSPVLMSIMVAVFVSSLGAYITHGFSKMTTSAIIGMAASIVIAASLAQAAVYFGHLSGITDETTYNMLSDPAYASVNFQGLLLGGIIIGLLGVLYDAAIGQAVAVEELANAGPHLSKSHIFSHAFRIGREHIGALVNTLILAYVGTQLPIILSFYPYGLGNFGAPPLNLEFIATEIIRTTVGSIGLMLTIPITTWVAVLLLVKAEGDADPAIIADERSRLLSMHSH